MNYSQVKMKYKLVKKKNVSPIEPVCKKTVYDSKKDAEEAIEYVTSGKRVNLKAYHCSVCGFWHLTSI
jgi:hypothetical protein